MHSYLGAIGFSQLQKKEWEDILNEVINDYDEKNVIEKENQESFVELSKFYGIDMGITACGEYDENHQFVMEYAFPFFRGSKVTTTEDVYVERRKEKEDYSGACEDMRLGVTLIFYLANAGSYLKERYKEKLQRYRTTVAISGLSLDAKIVLPLYKDPQQVEAERQWELRREKMFEEMRMNEDIDHWEEITREDIEGFDRHFKMIRENDILTAVDTYFIPYGMECDRYNILGEITEVTKTQNYGTHENVYQMSVLCNDMEFDICINENDLFGEPLVGRRFKGVIWAQGNLHFSE